MLWHALDEPPSPLGASMQPWVIANHPAVVVRRLAVVIERMLVERRAAAVVMEDVAHLHLVLVACMAAWH